MITVLMIGGPWDGREVDDPGHEYYEVPDRPDMSI